MSCTKHLLNLEWSQHKWQREVTGTETVSFQETDQWGRRFPQEFVRCTTRHVCTECGATRDEQDCGCDPDVAERCRIRLDCLATSAPSKSALRPSEQTRS
jgi:hypothetical protein